MRAGHGTVGVSAIVPASIPGGGRDGGITGVRWTTRIEQATAGILFQWSHLMGADGVERTHAALEVPVMPWTLLSTDDQHHGWPPKGASQSTGRPYLWPAISQYSGLETIGIGQPSSRKFSRQSGGVDGYVGLNKIAALPQFTAPPGLPVTIEIVRVGDLDTWRKRKRNYSWRQNAEGVWTPWLPSGMYARWEIRLYYPKPIGRQVIPLASGGEWGCWINPAECLAFLTEFFNRDVVQWRSRTYAHALLTENGTFPITQFRVHYDPEHAIRSGYGFRVVNGELECSTDGEGYAVQGDILEVA